VKLADIVSGLRRRWYIVIPGLILAVMGTVGAWTAVGDEYERTATQVLLPGDSSIPEDGNPYLYIGGLGQAAEIVVRALGSPNVLTPLLEEHPGVEVAIARDPTTSGPVFMITVLAPTDEAAAEVLGRLVAETSTVLEELQDQQDIAAPDRITVMPIFIDEESVVQRRNRVMITAFVGVGAVILVLVVAALSDGLLLTRARRHR